MNTVSPQAVEEASNIATEFIYSLDNLPNEVRHICEEIKYLDTKAYEIQSAVETECQKYIDLSRQPNGIPPNVKGPNQSRIAAAFAQISVLHQEKMLLAQQMVQLMQRTRNRLDVDIGKVRKLQGEPPLSDTQARANVSNAGFTFSSHAASQISESMRKAMLPTTASAATPPPVDSRASPAVVALTTAATPSGAATKKRRLGTSTPSIKLPARSISPVPPPKTAQPPRQSRLSRQLHLPPAPPPPEPEEDAEGDEEDAEGEEEEADDDKPYCFCQKKSFGDMIACDGTDCPYEWFHLSCVGLKTNSLAENEKWYCDVCQKKMAAQTNTRRRKK